MKETLKETVDDLLARYIQHKEIESVGYGEIEKYDVDKAGFDYPRAYLTLESAERRHITLTLTVTDKVKVDLSDRLEVQSSTLDIIKDLVHDMVENEYFPHDYDFEFDPTELFMGDSTEGFQTDITINVNYAGSCNKFV